MTTEKDAMALAVLQTIADYESTFARAPILEARAHLASRILHLTQNAEHQRLNAEAAAESAKFYKRSLDRAEAELAAVREDAEKRLAIIVRIRDDKSWRSNDNSLWPDIVDAARGGGDV